MQWIKSTLEARKTSVTDVTLANANTVVATKKKLKTAADKEVLARAGWLKQAENEVIAAGQDVARAEALLKALVEEIVPMARGEVDARTALTKAQDAYDEAVTAEE